MEKRGVRQGEGEAPADKRASDQKATAGGDAVSRAAEAAATPPRKPDPKK